ncbi:MAG: amidohydrolase family protein [Phycisphaeraceae bacterium]|nr:amidohydrolase family protein [Phycisphaeraceae bacterium]
MSSTVHDPVCALTDPADIALVDCDVHAGHNTIDDLVPYLPDVWQRYVRETGYKGPPATEYPKVKPMATRDDAHPPGGVRPGSDRKFLTRQHLDAYHVDRAVLTPLYGAECEPNADLAAAMCSAYNDFMIEHWLEADDRFFGSMFVPFTDPEASVREIERIGDHPKIVQLLFFVGSGVLFGKRRFHSIWKAAEQKNLAVAMHWGSRLPAFAAGERPSYYLEYHTNLAQTAMAQLVSLVCEGVFETCPKLRAVMIECGFAWLPALMWRLDKNWRGCRIEVPWLKRPPSEYVCEHVRFTSQPIEEPDDPNHLLRIIEMAGEHMLMFASDYPHWDFDSPTRALPSIIKGDLRDRIMHRNAVEFYGLT